MELGEFLQESTFPSLSLFADAGNDAIHVNGASIPLACMMAARRFFDRPGNMLVVAKDFKSAETWMENLQSLIGEDFVRFFPSIGLKPYEQKVPFEGVVEERLKFFRGHPHGVAIDVDKHLMRVAVADRIACRDERDRLRDDFLVRLDSREQ